MGNLRYGYKSIKQSEARRELRPKQVKRYYAPRHGSPDAPGKIIIVTPTLGDVPMFYEHHIWLPKRQGRGPIPRVPCKHEENPYILMRKMGREEREAFRAEMCPICSAATTITDIKCTCVAAFKIIDLSKFKTSEGEQWQDTIKWWLLPKLHAELICELIASTRRNKGKEIDDASSYGAFFEVRRVGQQASAGGDNFQIQGFNNMAFMAQSPRAAWYQKKLRREGRDVSLQEAAKIYMDSLDPDEFLYSDMKADFFLEYVRSATGVNPNKQDLDEPAAPYEETASAFDLEPAFQQEVSSESPFQQPAPPEPQPKAPQAPDAPPPVEDAFASPFQEPANALDPNEPATGSGGFAEEVPVPPEALEPTQDIESFQELSGAEVVDPSDVPTDTKDIDRG